MIKITLRENMDKSSDGFRVNESFLVDVVPRIGEVISLQDGLLQVEDVWHKYIGGQREIVVWVYDI